MKCSRVAISLWVAAIGGAVVALGTAGGVGMAAVVSPDLPPQMISPCQTDALSGVIAWNGSAEAEATTGPVAEQSADPYTDTEVENYYKGYPYSYESPREEPAAAQHQNEQSFEAGQEAQPEAAAEQQYDYEYRYGYKHGYQTEYGYEPPHNRYEAAYREALDEQSEQTEQAMDAAVEEPAAPTTSDDDESYDEQSYDEDSYGESAEMPTYSDDSNEGQMSYEDEAADDESDEEDSYDESAEMPAYTEQFDDCQSSGAESPYEGQSYDLHRYEYSPAEMKHDYYDENANSEYDEFNSGATDGMNAAETIEQPAEGGEAMSSEYDEGFEANEPAAESQDGLCPQSEAYRPMPWSEKVADEAQATTDLSAWLPGELLTEQDQNLIRLLARSFEERDEVRRTLLNDYLETLGWEAMKLASRFEDAAELEVLGLNNDLPTLAALLGTFRLMERGELDMDRAVDLLSHEFGSLSEQWIDAVDEIATVEQEETTTLLDMSGEDDGAAGRTTLLWTLKAWAEQSYDNAGVAFRNIMRQVADLGRHAAARAAHAERSAAQSGTGLEYYTF